MTHPASTEPNPDLVIEEHIVLGLAGVLSGLPSDEEIQRRERVELAERRKSETSTEPMYLIGESEIDTIRSLFSMPEHSMEDADYQAQDNVLANIRARGPVQQAPKRDTRFYEKLALLHASKDCHPPSKEALICGNGCPARQPSCENGCPLYEHDAAIAAQAREDVLKQISESLETCAFYDEMISGEGGCLGNRNGERECDGCSYFEIDGNQLRATIESLRSEVKK